MSQLRAFVKGVDQVARSLERKRKATESKVGDAVVLGAKTIRDAGDTLAQAPFRKRGLFRNVQDAPRRTRVSSAGLVQARFSRETLTAEILAKAHFTTARSPAIKAVLSRTGQTRLLFRRSLWIKRGSSKGKTRSHKGHPDRNGLQQVSLAAGLSRFGGSRRRHIREWALPRDLDQADTVRIKGEALRQIILGPAVFRNEKKVLAHLQRAARKGLLS